MKENKALVYATRRNIQSDLDRDYNLYTNEVIRDWHHNIQPVRYEKTHEVGSQYDYKRDNLTCTCRNISSLRRRRDVRYFRSPKQVYAYYERSRSFTDIDIGSVKALHKKKVQRIYLPETDDRGCGSCDLSSDLRRTKQQRTHTRNSYYGSKRTSSKCVGGILAYNKGSVVSEKLSPIIQTISKSTSPQESENRNIEIGSNTVTKVLTNIITQVDHLIDKEVDNQIDSKNGPTLLEEQSQEDKCKVTIVNSREIRSPNTIKERKCKDLERFSSDSLVQYVHELENPSDDVENQNIGSEDLMENKLEREYRKIFSTKSKVCRKPSTDRRLPDNKSASILKRRFEALRRGLARKDDSKKCSTISPKMSSQVSIIATSHRDVSINFDPLSLEDRSFYNTKMYSPYAFPSIVEHDKSDIYNPQSSYKRAVNRPQRASVSWSKTDEEDSECKLWGKKFNFEEDFVTTISKPFEVPKKTSEEKEELHEKPKVAKTNAEEKEKRKFFFFKKKTKDEKKEKPFKPKKDITAGRCEAKEGLMIKIGNVEQVYKTEEKLKSPKPARKVYDEETGLTAWLQRYLSHGIESRNSVKVRWNNKMYGTSSSTVFELMDNVYRDTGIIFRAKSEMKIQSSYYKPYSKRQNENFAQQNIEAWMIPKTVTEHPQKLPGKVKRESNKAKNESMEVRISDQKWFIDKSKAFSHKLEVVLLSKNLVRCDKKESSEYLRIDIPKGFFVNSSKVSDDNNINKQNQSSDEEVYKIVEYETGSDLKKEGNFYKPDNESNNIKVTLSVKSHRNFEQSVLDTVIKTPLIYRDVIIQGSKVYISKRRDVVGVGITQREMEKPIMTIHQDGLSDDDSEHDLRLYLNKCNFTESYLQEYYRQWAPTTGMDLFSWCVSDSHLRCCSEPSKLSFLNQADGTKSCPNILEDYQVIVSSCETSQSSCCRRCYVDEPYEPEPCTNNPRWYQRLEKFERFSPKVECDCCKVKEDPNRRLLPKDSIEVFRRRKIYASMRSQWYTWSDGVPCSVPSTDCKAAGLECTSPKVECGPAKKTCWEPTERRPKRADCDAKHVFLPNCEVIKNMIKGQVLEPEGIPAFKGAMENEPKKKASCRLSPEHACEIPPVACQPECKKIKKRDELVRLKVCKLSCASPPKSPCASPSKLPCSPPPKPPCSPPPKPPCSPPPKPPCSPPPKPPCSPPPKPPCSPPPKPPCSPPPKPPCSPPPKPPCSPPPKPPCSPPPKPPCSPPPKPPCSPPPKPPCSRPPKPPCSPPPRPPRSPPPRPPRSPPPRPPYPSPPPPCSPPKPPCAPKQPKAPCSPPRSPSPCPPLPPPCPLAPPPPSSLKYSKSPPLSSPSMPPKCPSSKSLASCPPSPLACPNSPCKIPNAPCYQSPCPCLDPDPPSRPSSPSNCPFAPCQRTPRKPRRSFFFNSRSSSSQKKTCSSCYSSSSLPLIPKFFKSPMSPCKTVPKTCCSPTCSVVCGDSYSSVNQNDDPAVSYQYAKVHPCPPDYCGGIEKPKYKIIPSLVAMHPCPQCRASYEEIHPPNQNQQPNQKAGATYQHPEVSVNKTRYPDSCPSLRGNMLSTAAAKKCKNLNCPNYPFKILPPCQQKMLSPSISKPCCPPPPPPQTPPPKAKCPRSPSPPRPRSLTPYAAGETKPRLSGVHLRITPSRKGPTSSPGCPDVPPKHDHTNSLNKITLMLKKETPSTEENRERLDIKVQDKNGVTLFEQKDCVKSCLDTCDMPKTVLEDVYKNLYVPRIATPVTSHTDYNKEISEDRSNNSIANIIEIQFKLKVTQGDESTEINIANDDMNKSDIVMKDQHPGKSPQNVFVLKDDGAQSDDKSDGKSDGKNDIDIRIVIKNFKPKSAKSNDFSKQISGKFHPVSTEDTTHRATLVDLTSSEEKSKAQTRQSKDTMSEPATEQEPDKIDVSSSVTEVSIYECMAGDRQPRISNGELQIAHDKVRKMKSYPHDTQEESDAEKPETDTEKPETDFEKPETDNGKPETDTEKPETDVDKLETYTEKPETDSDKPETDKEKPGTDAEKPKTDADNSETDIEKPETDMDKLETDMEKHSERKCYTIVFTDIDEQKRYEERDTGSLEIIKISCTKEEKKEIMKHMFEKSRDVKKNEFRMKKWRDMLKVILKSDSSEPEEVKMPSTTSNNLATDVTYASLRPNYFRKSDSMNNYFRVENDMAISDREINKPIVYPTEDNNSDSSESSSVTSDNYTPPPAGGCILCSTVAKRLKMASRMCSGGGGCFCSKPKPLVIKSETCCDMKQCSDEYQDEEDKEPEYVDVETQNSRYLASKVTSTDMLVESSIKSNLLRLPIDLQEQAITDSFLKYQATSSKYLKPFQRSFTPYMNHVKQCEMRKLNRNTILSISGEDKIFVVSAKPTRICSEESKVKDYKKKNENNDAVESPEILQSYETKKAVLEIYTERNVTNKGESLVVQLPKFVYDAESEIYNAISTNCYVCTNNIIMMI